LDESILSALRQLAAFAPVVALRDSFWVYPAVNTLHILGIVLLVGSVLPLDLRLLGAFKRYPVRPIAKIMVPIATCGVVLTILSGLMLFAVNPVDYVRTDLFLVKIGLIGAAGINAALLSYNASWNEIVVADESLLNITEPDRKLQIAAFFSLLFWIAVLTCGRFVGYVL
jgi:hypothetical protein